MSPLSRTVLAYALAVLLPALSSVLLSHSAVLLTIPFSLYFISLSVIAILGGIGPALVGVAFCVISRNYFIAPGERLLAFNLPSLYRLSVLITCAVLVSALEHRRRSTTQRLEGALQDLRDRSDALVESLHASKCASWFHDFRTGQAAQWYFGSYPIFGRPFEDLQDLATLHACLHPEDLARLPELERLMQTTTDPFVWEYRVIWPGGKVHTLEMRAVRVPGEPVIWRGITVDISERKLTESMLLRSEKLAAMGRLASTVAHEINNPLESVTNLLYLARTDPDLSAGTYSYLTTAELELARLGDITRLTLGFVRNSAARADLEVVTVVDEVLSIFRHRLDSRRVTVQRDMDPSVRVHMAAHELRQILTNLISNAADALSGADGIIRIEIAHTGPEATIAVADNGHGIQPDALPRIFEPFFTTKQDVGTGIGLWVTRELAESNGGRITAETGDLAHGMHTCFRLHFPAPPATLAA